jgi:hypothetical protein
MKRWRFAVGAGIIVAALIGVGLAQVTAAGPLNRGQDPQPTYKVNVNGMTYGSGLDATSPSTEPDLIEAIGAGGIQGYVRSADLTPAEPTSPSDAARQNSGVLARVIPLYAVDGVTVIGAFQLTAPDPGEPGPPQP